jgi:hypothetical protein
MRESLRKSLEHSPAAGWERYPQGSVVLCNACAAPIYRLDRAISLGDRAGASASAYKPLDDVDLTALAAREDIDAGVRARVRGWTAEERKAHLAKLHEARSGDPMLCPACGDCFVQVTSTERHEALDRAYTIELLTIPPQGMGRPAPLRGKSPGRDWLQ